MVTGIERLCVFGIFLFSVSVPYKKVRILQPQFLSLWIVSENRWMEWSIHSSVPCDLTLYRSPVYCLGPNFERQNPLRGSETQSKCH